MVLNFTAPRYTLLFLYSEIYIVHVIYYEWSRFVNFPLHMFCMRYKYVFFQQLVSEWSSISNLYNVFCEFWNQDNSFMMLEDYTFNFLHGCWNYFLMKTDIDVMMLFKFDIKYFKLNFKAIASMEFSFDINLYLLCSYDGCLFMKNCWKLLQKNSRKFEFHEFRSIENCFRSIEWNSDQSIWFDWYSIANRSIKCSFSIDRETIEYQLSQANC